MIGIKQIKVDGTVVNLKRKVLSLKEMQDLVSTGTKRSYIELVCLPGQFTDRVGDKVMFVHEEGLICELPVNVCASSIAGQSLVGDAIICENQASDFR